MVRDWERVGTWLFGYRWVLPEHHTGEVIGYVREFGNLYTAFCEASLGEYVTLEDAKKAVLNKLKE